MLLDSLNQVKQYFHEHTHRLVFLEKITDTYEYTDNEMVVREESGRVFRYPLFLFDYDEVFVT